MGLLSNGPEFQINLLEPHICWSELDLPFPLLAYLPLDFVPRQIVVCSRNQDASLHEKLSDNAKSNLIQE